MMLETLFAHQQQEQAFLSLMVCGLVLGAKEQASFNFMAAVTLHIGFRAQENKVCHCFYCFPIYLP